MLKHVLVPLDGSPLSEEALEYAKQILAPDGTLILVMAVDLPELVPGGFYMAFGAPMHPSASEDSDYSNPEKALAQARRYLDDISERIRSSIPVSVEVRAEISDPASMIVKYAKKQNADVIVMSTHGRSGFSKWFFGSVTNKVLNITTCPVMVIPNKNRQAEVEQSLAEANYG